MADGMYGSRIGSTTVVQQRPIEPRLLSREEHMARERLIRGSGYRAPRRANSTQDYVYPSTFTWAESRAATQASTANTVNISIDNSQRPETICEEAGCASGASTAAATVAPAATLRNGSTAAEAAVMAAAASTTVTADGCQPKRPKMGTPRRSYSVMDYEPVPQLPPNLSLGDLPAELHYVLFDFLDPIDSTCLGLTNKHFYTIHRRMHGKIPLSARRAGPNDMEWVWHTAGRKSAAEQLEATTKALRLLRVQGQALCRKCGVSRCELHKHIQNWMGPGYEYCTVREKFGPPAPAGAKEFCYLSNPKDRHRCGRHRPPKSRPSTPKGAQSAMVPPPPSPGATREQPASIAI